jgi:hypothetical protein
LVIIGEELRPLYMPPPESEAEFAEKVLLVTVGEDER